MRLWFHAAISRPEINKQTASLTPHKTQRQDSDGRKTRNRPQNRSNEGFKCCATSTKRLSRPWAKYQFLRRPHQGDHFNDTPRRPTENCVDSVKFSKFFPRCYKPKPSYTVARGTCCNAPSSSFTAKVLTLVVDYDIYFTLIRCDRRHPADARQVRAVAFWVLGSGRPVCMWKGGFPSPSAQ
jgi:hypothetical protein